MNYEGYPDPGELVVCKIEEIEDFGVFADLQAYEDKRGLIHISEVASGWIKNVSDHVNTGQIAVCKVLDIDESSQHIDLSLKDVNDHQRSDTIQEWKNEQKADKWLTRAFGEALEDSEFRRIANALLDAHPSLYEAFEEAAIHGADALDAVELDEEEVDAIVDCARENVSVPYVSVTGYVDLTSDAPDGVDVVKRALEAAEGNGSVPENIDLEVTYVGAPEYRIRVEAPDYKTAEDELEASAERAIDSASENGASGAFHRERAEAEQ